MCIGIFLFSRHAERVTLEDILSKTVSCHWFHFVPHSIQRMFRLQSEKALLGHLETTDEKPPGSQFLFSELTYFWELQEEKQSTKVWALVCEALPPHSSTWDSMGQWCFLLCNHIGSEIVSVVTDQTELCLLHTPPSPLGPQSVTEFETSL